MSLMQGDLVKCVEDNGTDNTIRNGQIYRISKVDPMHNHPELTLVIPVSLTDPELEIGAWFEHRFEKLTQ